MSKSSSKVNIRKSDIRERVIDAALHLFTQQGYFNTSIPDIVSASNCSTGSIYHHFKDKEGIAKALFESLVERMNIAFDDIENQYSSAHDRCHAIIKLLFFITETEPDIMNFILYARHKEFLPNNNPICSSRPFQKMREFVTKGMTDGEILAMDDIVAAASIYGGALRMIHLRLDGVLNKSLMDKLDDVWKCAWRSVVI